MTVTALPRNQPTASSSLEWVDPATAKDWIARNHKNRTLRPSLVSRFARDMATGHWLVTGEAIKFDWDGNFIDGQHRVHAIVESGATIQTFVVRNLPPEAQDVMDTGLKRTASDALTFHGHKNVHLLAAVARLAISYRNGDFRHALASKLSDPTNTEVISFVQENPDILESASRARAHYQPIALRKSVIGFTLWQIRRVAGPGADAFFEDLLEYRTTGSGDPRSALLRRLEAVRRDRENLSAITECYMVFRTWNAVVKGESLTHIRYSGSRGPYEFQGPVSA